VRTAQIERKTRETSIRMRINLDGAGNAEVSTGIGFFDHMLESFAKHGVFDIEVHADGDLTVDQHHTVEDTGIVLGKAVMKALGGMEGVVRSGFSLFPMDESLAVVAVDISGRPHTVMKVEFSDKTVGGFSTDLVHDFFHGFSSSGFTVHVQVPYGRSDHHKIEAVFKAFGRALRMACDIDERRKGLPTTKGLI